jgi:hypothetical protein
MSKLFAWYDACLLLLLSLIGLLYAEYEGKDALLLAKRG